jgi:polysaccharide export outer membrane protein
MNRPVTRVLQFCCVVVLFAVCALSQPVEAVSPDAAQTVAPVEMQVAPVKGTAESTTGAAPARSSIAGSRTLSSEIRIGGGDLLEVSVFGAPDYVRQVRVSAEGSITLPLAGTVKVGGLTTEQAAAVIAKKLSDGGYFNDPKVAVLEKQFATQGISVLGEVQKPGIYPLPGSRNVYDAISAAGGTTPRAGNVISITHRSDPDHPQSVALSYDANNLPKNNIPVYPGDTVLVSKAGLVYVTGDVKRQGGFVMENSQMTVLQAIAMAQGPLSTAALSRAQVIRNPGQGKSQQEIPIPLKKILAAKAPDMPLQANDIVFVPNSKMKSVTKKTLDSIVQVATGMAMVAR